MLDIKVINKNADGSFRVEPCGCENNITVYDVRFCAGKMCSPEKITVEFNIPYVGAFSVWNSGCGLVRNILPDWRPEHQVSKSRLASGIPIQSVISQDGSNVFT